jgi:acetyltransferase
MYTAGAVAKALIPVIHASRKPVVVALMGERLIQEAVEHFRAARVPEYRFPERAASALATLAQWAEHLARAQAREAGPPGPLAGIDRREARRGIAQLRKDPASSQAMNSLLAAYGIPVLPVSLVRSAAQARQAADRLGYPLALKVASPDILHKSDVGGVLLDLHNADEAAQGYTTVINNARQARPEAMIQGAHLQRMAPMGQEVILGAVQDAQFGALVMFGSGGVEVEGLKDVAFALAPLTRDEAEYLLENTWAGRKLSGFRSLAPADREATIQTVLRLGQLAADYPEIKEIEVNPLRVLPAGQGVVAVDGRVKF